MTLPRWTWAALWMAAGALAMDALVDLLGALSGPGAPALWWTTRALGLVALVSLWLGMLFGLMLSVRGGPVDAPTLLQLHQHHLLAAAVATALHALLAVADTHAEIPAIAAVIPMTSTTLTGPISVGVLALWGLAVVLVSTALRARLGPTAWRAVHLLAYGTFTAAAGHAWTAGTDAGWARAGGLAGCAVLLAATVQRALLAWHTAAPDDALRARRAPP